MANTDNPKGFHPISEKPSIHWYPVDAANTPIINKGDLVTKETDGYCVRLSTENLVLGAVVEIKDTNKKPIVTLPTLTAGWLGVADDPNERFIAQVNGTYAVTANGANFDITDAAGDAVLGQSNQEIDYSTLNTTEKQIRIIELYDAPDNAVGADADVICHIVQHQNRHLTGI